MATSPQRDSYHKTLSELGPRQHEVYVEISQSFRGLSAWELADKLGRLVHAVRPRIVELKDKGVVRESGERWEPRTQRNEAIWVACRPEDNGQLGLGI